MMPCQKARSNGIKIEIRKKAKAAGRVCLVVGLFSDLLGLGFSKRSLKSDRVLLGMGGCNSFNRNDPNIA